jgi:hypothetical protein
MEDSITHFYIQIVTVFLCLEDCYVPAMSGDGIVSFGLF